MKNIRFIVLMLAGGLFVLAAFAVELHYMRLGNVSFLTKLIVFILLNLNLVALLTLMFFVTKNLVKVYLERKHKVLGYKFKTRFVVVLVVLTMIPSVLLFIVSSSVITSYLDRWFDPQIRQPLELSLEIAKAAYDMQRQQTLAFAEAIAAGGKLPGNYTVSRFSTLPDNASEAIRSGFEGTPDVEVITGEEIDTVRAVVPELKGGRQIGVIVVESVVSTAISKNVIPINTAYKNYLTLESWKTPIKVNYLLILSFFTLMAIFMALWLALRVSRGITDSVQMLAQATEEVAKGNLDTRVDILREDEIGLLVTSFNHMVRELRESKDSLQSALKESDRRRIINENILENINSGVISLDPSGNILTINSAASRILEITPEEVIGENYEVLLVKLKSDELRETVRQVRIRDSRVIEREIRVTAGERRILLRIFLAALGDVRNFLGTLVVFDDLTELVRAQRALAWEEVARRIAHEIKNPLTPIKLSTDHMIKKWQNKDDDFGVVFERSTKTISKEVESLKRLVNEFSRFGKMPEVKKSPVLISSVIDNVLNLYKDYKGLEIRPLIMDNEPLVELDAEQFKRVIINIVENAIQAMQAKGVITISVSRDLAANRIFVDIADRGPGIREEDRERLFLPYFSTKKDGTGLGLAIASRIITEHRGYIRIRDNKPQGTIFSIELPVREG
ncbi:MAG: HAMP domain-containing protein [Nitrospirae bacterium]|nr:MAG: HAMP domain-containing protein [Nitrospirota bacterium]